MQEATRKLDKAASKGVIHANQAAEPEVGDRQARRLVLGLTRP